MIEINLPRKLAGIAKIEILEGRDNMIGDQIEITTDDGEVIQISCLGLGDHTGAISLIQAGKGESLNDITYDNFGNNLPTEIGRM